IRHLIEMNIIFLCNGSPGGRSYGYARAVVTDPGIAAVRWLVWQRMSVSTHPSSSATPLSIILLNFLF
ncbi:hypothetical protein RSAG8_13444, partial [Rhizoctonia solani AG-8 WAC10335]